MPNPRGCEDGFRLLPGNGGPVWAPGMAGGRIGYLGAVRRLLERGIGGRQCQNGPFCRLTLPASSDLNRVERVRNCSVQSKLLKLSHPPLPLRSYDTKHLIMKLSICAAVALTAVVLSTPTYAKVGESVQETRQRFGLENLAPKPGDRFVRPWTEPDPEQRVSRWFNYG